MGMEIATAKRQLMKMNKFDVVDIYWRRTEDTF